MPRHGFLLVFWVSLAEIHESVNVCPYTKFWKVWGNISSNSFCITMVQDQPERLEQFIHRISLRSKVIKMGTHFMPMPFSKFQIPCKICLLLFIPQSLWDFSIFSSVCGYSLKKGQPVRRILYRTGRET